MNKRLILLCFLVLYFVLFIAVYVHFNNYTKACEIFGIGSPKPAGDLRIVTCSMECLRKGMDIRSKEVYDICGMNFNYTKFAERFYFYTGIKVSYTETIAIVLTILYFFVIFKFIGDIDLFGLVIYVILLYSPAFMLLVERANIDMQIFIALYIALYFLRKNKAAISGLIILFVSFIKLYPICAISMFFNRTVKNNIKIFVITSMFYLLYIFIIRGEFTAINNLTSRGATYSYGAHVFIDCLYLYLDGWGISKYVPFSLTQFHLLFFLIALLIVSLGASKGFSEKSEDEDTLQIGGLRLGAAIYIGTFLLGNNWIYRLCFIIFTIPQILIWCKREKALKRFSILALTCIIVYVYNDYWVIRDIFLSMFNSVLLLFFIKEFAAWFLLFYYSYTLALTIPSSTRVGISRLLSKQKILTNP